MNDILVNAQNELAKLRDTPQGEHIKTGDIRRLSAILFRSLKDRSKENVFSVCNNLLEQRNWPMGVIAFDFAHRMKKHYDGSAFALFESWLKRYVRG